MPGFTALAASGRNALQQWGGKGGSLSRALVPAAPLLLSLGQPLTPLCLRN